MGAQVKIGESSMQGGFFVFELFVSLISGPFFFFHRLHKLRQLSSYIKN